MILAEAICQKLVRRGVIRNRRREMLANLWKEAARRLASCAAHVRHVKARGVVAIEFLNGNMSQEIDQGPIILGIFSSHPILAGVQGMQMVEIIRGGLERAGLDEL